MEMDNIMLLNDEQGNQIPFEFLDLIEYHDEEYVVLLPVSDEEVGQVLILRIETIEGDEDEENYVSVDDAELTQTIFDIFRQQNSEDFEFVD